MAKGGERALLKDCASPLEEAQRKDEQLDRWFHAQSSVAHSQKVLLKTTQKGMILKIQKNGSMIRSIPYLLSIRQKIVT